VFHIEETKVFIYYGKFSTKSLQQIQSGERVTEKSTIYRYPTDGFDLSDTSQRKRLYEALFKVFQYSTSSQAKLSSKPSSKVPSFRTNNC